VHRLRELLAKREDPYAGIDLANASRLGGALWLVGAVLTLVLLPLAPPDDELGDAGWPVAAIVIAGAGVSGMRLRALGASVHVDELLAHSYVALAALTLLTWLSGGLGSPYSQLFILSVIFTAGVHPPRRVIPYLAVLVAAALAPLAYDEWDGREALEYGTEVFIWIALALAGLALMGRVREQRLGLRREGETARRQARIDPLTGLLNRRAFDEMLAHAVGRARVAGEPLSVLIGDLDGFKDLNDRFGHLEGDRMLNAVADSLRRALRRPDVAYRWGGDEFALILPGADLAAAEHVAERARAAVSANLTPAEEPLTMATGVAQLGDPAQDDAQGLLDRADRALFDAKAPDALELPGEQS
jgi:diguanylate cyclase (GGDEF)-like protein